ncbi:basic proline-rich protein-like [Iris pallida]|uniref:Basic proline-rich protein-like n=1 Tax=Iris pallida TaxID=29817 RepID=A0AAX6IEG1_IRIPA|nr:basic proline-rich protein-like [Iris pallida]
MEKREQRKQGKREEAYEFLGGERTAPVRNAGARKGTRGRAAGPARSGTAVGALARRRSAVESHGDRRCSASPDSGRTRPWRTARSVVTGAARWRRRGWTADRDDAVHRRWPPGRMAPLL